LVDLFYAYLCVFVVCARRGKMEHPAEVLFYRALQNGASGGANFSPACAIRLQRDGSVV
jgi:hypothetical protein